MIRESSHRLTVAISCGVGRFTVKQISCMILSQEKTTKIQEKKEGEPMQTVTAYSIDEDVLLKYSTFLQGEERSESTIQKYLYNISVLLKYLNGRSITKELLIQWKRNLSGSYSTATVNSMLTAVNNFLRFLGWPKLAVKGSKVRLC